jgi:hypothetical protein
MNEHVDRLRRWAEGLAESAGGDPRDMPQWGAADALERAEAVVAAARAYVTHWTMHDQPSDWEDERNRRAFALGQALAAYDGA